jgi:hypothetical protein
MFNITRTIRRAALGLGLLGSAALISMGPLSAHAAGPYLHTEAGNCSVYTVGTGFRPMGKVDLYAYRFDGTSWHYINDYVKTASTDGVISQLVWDQNNAETIFVMAYDRSANLWSNYTETTEYCLT